MKEWVVEIYTIDHHDYHVDVFGQEIPYAKWHLASRSLYDRAVEEGPHELENAIQQLTKHLNFKIFKPEYRSADRYRLRNVRTGEIISGVLFA